MCLTNFRRFLLNPGDILLSLSYCYICLLIIHSNLSKFKEHVTRIYLYRMKFPKVVLTVTLMIILVVFDTFVNEYIRQSYRFMRLVHPRLRTMYWIKVNADKAVMRIVHDYHDIDKGDEYLIDKKVLTRAPWPWLLGNVKKEKDINMKRVYQK